MGSVDSQDRFVKQSTLSISLQIDVPTIKLRTLN
jgi:hypothetical protein